LVNDNFGHGRIRVDAQSSTPSPQIVPNPDGAALEPGAVVVPHYADPAARIAHVPGLILSIEGDQALVRWAPGDRHGWCPLSELVKR
jgi:hypothetical protein